MTNGQRRRLEAIERKAGIGGYFTISEEHAERIFEGEPVDLPAARGMVHRIYYSTPEASAAYRDMMTKAFPHFADHEEAFEEPHTKNAVKAYQTSGGYTFRLPNGGSRRRLVFPDGREALILSGYLPTGEEAEELEEELKAFFSPAGEGPQENGIIYDE